MKTRTNVSISPELLEAARAADLPLSAILEEAIRDRLAQLEAKRWLTENRERIARYGDYVAENGTFGDSLRDF